MQFPRAGGRKNLVLGKGWWLAGILGMYSEDQGMFFQLLLLLPIPRMTLWTPCHYSQAQKENLQPVFTVFLVTFLLCRALSSVLVCSGSHTIILCYLLYPFQFCQGAILTEENDIQRGEEIPPGLDSRNNETRI